MIEDSTGDRSNVRSMIDRRVLVMARFPSVFRRRLQKNKMTTPDLLRLRRILVDEGRIKKKETFRTSRVFEQSSHGLRSKIQKREVKVKETKDRGPWWCHRIVNRFVIAGEGEKGKRSSSFGSKGWHNGNFRFETKSCSPFRLVYRRIVRRFLFFFFYRGCYADASMEHESFVRVHHVWQEVKASKQSILLKYSGELGAVSRRSEILFMDRDNVKLSIGRWRDFYLIDRVTFKNFSWLENIVI